MTAGLTAAGMATAGVLLTTTVTGEATIRTVPAPEAKVALSVTGTLGGALDCRQVGVAADYRTLTFKPVLARTEGGPSSEETCTLTLKVRNTGTVPVHLDTMATTIAGPAGWTASAPSGAATRSIAPNAVAEATVTITAGTQAVEGRFSGQLVYSSEDPTTAT